MQGKSKKSKIVFTAVILAMLTAAVAAIYLILRQAEIRQREELIGRARIVCNAVNFRYLLSLSGSDADLSMPEYQRIKEQLIHVRMVIPRCRFIYLMGRKSSGEIFFYVDSEPQGSKDESPPGQVYTESPEIVKDVFTSRQGASGAPYTDRWGSWVSSFVPLTDPDTGRLAAVLGMDVDAHNWERDILRRCYLPLGLIFILALSGIFITLLIFSRRATLESQKLFRDLFQNTISGIAIHEIILDSQGKPVDYVFLDANKAFERNTGLYLGNILGKRVSEVFLDIHKTSLMDIYGDVVLSGKPRVFEYFFESLGRSYNISAFRIGGKRFVTAIQDITESKRSEKELKLLYEQLKDTQAKLVQSAKMASLGILAGGVAHEINNPLTGVLNNAQLIRMMLEKKIFDYKAFDEILARIEESAVRCTNITKSLLDFSRVSKGTFVRANMNDIINKVSLLVQKELELENIKLEKELDAALPDVVGDNQLLQQAILDIINNSRWALLKREPPQPGVIRIKTAFDSQSGQVVVSISDNGIGILKENMDKIFEPFFTTKNVGEGTGLGLSIVYNIIKAHKGSIETESELGSGAAFHIRLPVDKY